MNVLHRQSRIWFARVTVRIITAPFYPCRFKDFFINDQYMSLGVTFEMFGLLIYYTFKGKTAPTTLSSPAIWYIFTLQLFPGLWRSLQCIRRFHDSKMSFPHLANLAKYICSLAVPFIIGVFKMSGFNALWYVVVVARIVSSMFSLGWDIVMDFGLWQRSTVNDRLRNTILFSPWVYWYLIVSDTIARFLWILPMLQPRLFPTIPLIAINMSLWTLEALRRFQWNFFRVEYEHVNNCNVLRAIADVQLPFTATDLFYQDMVETIQKQRETSPGPISPSDGVSSPASSVGEEELDEEEYGEDLSYEQQLEMVQKSAADLDQQPEQRSSMQHPSQAVSGWSSPPGGRRPTVSTMFNKDNQHKRNSSVE
jgi:hypothetical protein